MWANASDALHFPPTMFKPLQRLDGRLPAVHDGSVMYEDPFTSYPDIPLTHIPGHGWVAGRQHVPESMDGFLEVGDVSRADLQQAGTVVCAGEHLPVLPRPHQLVVSREDVQQFTNVTLRRRDRQLMAVVREHTAAAVGVRDARTSLQLLDTQWQKDRKSLGLQLSGLAGTLSCGGGHRVPGTGGLLRDRDRCLVSQRLYETA
jgi:hypothetical protein